MATFRHGEERHTGALVSQAGAMCWNEVMTPEIDTAGRFYPAVSDWTSDVVDTSEDSFYTIFKDGTAMIGPPG